MADYREVKGTTIQTKDTDPVINTGQVVLGLQPLV